MNNFRGDLTDVEGMSRRALDMLNMECVAKASDFVLSMKPGIFGIPSFYEQVFFIIKVNNFRGDLTYVKCMSRKALDMLNMEYVTRASDFVFKIN